MVPALPHSPLGAHASFILGGSAEEQGLVSADGSVKRLEVVVGCRPGLNSAWNLLPFYSPAPERPQPLPKARFGRFLAAAGDKWMIGPLVFKLSTPFALSIAAQDERFWYAPVICGYLEYDNSHNDESAELVFGVSGEDLPHGSSFGSGFDFAGRFGFTTARTTDVRVARSGELFNGDESSLSALIFSVPPASKRVYPLVLGFFERGLFYTEHFSGLREILEFGLSNHAQYLAQSDALDREFMRSQISVEQKTSAAQALRSWLAASRRLAGESPLDLTALRTIWGGVVPPS